MGTPTERGPEKEKSDRRLMRIVAASYRMQKTDRQAAQALFAAKCGMDVLVISYDPERYRLRLRALYDTHADYKWPTFKEIMKLIKVKAGNDMPTGYSGKWTEGC